MPDVTIISVQGKKKQSKQNPYLGNIHPGVHHDQFVLQVCLGSPGRPGQRTDHPYKRSYSEPHVNSKAFKEKEVVGIQNEGSAAGNQKRGKDNLWSILSKVYNTTNNINV